MRVKSRSATLVVIEYGGTWPRWLVPGRSGDMAVVAQHYEGHPRSLVAQVASRVTRLESMGWEPSRIVLVSNGRVDRTTAAARSVIARGLLARLGSAGGGELVLTLGEGAEARSAQSLVSLAAGLEPSPDTAQVGLCVRLGQGAPLYSRAAASEESLAHAS
jgi:hypothetical protein